MALTLFLLGRVSEARRLKKRLAFFSRQAVYSQTAWLLFFSYLERDSAEKKLIGLLFLMQWTFCRGRPEQWKIQDFSLFGLFQQLTSIVSILSGFSSNLGYITYVGTFFFQKKPFLGPHGDFSGAHDFCQFLRTGCMVFLIIIYLMSYFMILLFKMFQFKLKK